MIEIQTLADGSTPHYSQRAVLDGAIYTLTLRWLSRLDRWALSIYLQDGTPVLTGRIVTVYTDLLAGSVVTGRPRGRLLAVPQDGANRDPTLTDLGSRVLLWYQPEAEL